MSTVTAIFLKDARQFRILTCLLLALLAVLVAVRLEWTGSIAPDPSATSFMSPVLEALLALVCLVLAGKMTSYVIFEDSPCRKERFLATRPVPVRDLLLAKCAFLATFALAPFALATVLYLALSGMPAGVVLLGTVQSLLWGLTLLGLGVSLVLLWETRRRLLAGIAAGAAGIGAFTLVLALLFERRSAMPSFRPDVFAEPLIQVITVATAALLLALLATAHLRKSLGMTPRLAGLFLIGALAPLVAGLCSARHSPVPGDPPPPSTMLGLGLNLQQVDGKPVLGISLVPSIATPLDQDTVWHCASLRLDEKALPIHPRSNPRLVHSHYLHSDFSRGIEAGLRRHLGPGWALVSARYGRDMKPRPASAFARPPLLPAGPRASLETVLKGHCFSWHSVAELPLIPGSSIRDGGNTWTFHGSARDRGEDLKLSLTHHGPELWLTPQPQTPRFENSRHRFALLDPERHLIHLIDDMHPVRKQLALGSACPRHGLVLRIEGGGRNFPDFAAADLEKMRLLILRPRYEGVRFTRWSSPQAVDLPPRQSSTTSGLAHPPRDIKAADIARWIEAHPGPAPDAPPAEIARYLVAVLEQTNRCSRIKETHPAVSTLATYVPQHLDLFFRGLDSLHMDHHTSDQLLRNAIVTGIERRQLPELVTRVSTDSNMMWIVEKRGWIADIAPDLARLIRNGIHDRALLTAAASLPDQAGITREEWRALFQLYPTPQTYRILCQIPDLEPALAAEVDALLAASIPMLIDHSVDPLISLALSRGHPRGPAMLHQAVDYSLQLDRFNSHWFSHVISSNIDLSACPDHHGNPEIFVPWFLKQDPASFTYTPASQLYTQSPSALTTDH